MSVQRRTSAGPGQQAGSPVIRAEATTDTIYPYALQVGDHESVRLPMTAAGVRSLRDALTALLDGTASAPADDFVSAWARANGAVVVDSAAAGPDTEAYAQIVPFPVREAPHRLAA
ncbi:hypothetical protein [Krasilnikovia sp. MM14-A1259]|uniref:hypothetical protein n=1 Tax=Krasilnikovia sp. MM14-A1259 TaxID=3373539 RepID=UPI003803A04E